MEEIIWVPVSGYMDYYEICKHGVKSLVRPYRKKEKVLKISISKGYPSVGLCKNGKMKTWRLHRLLMVAFVPNPLNLPCINHKDGNKLNYALDNMEWCTHKHNSIHAYDTGLITPKKGALNGMCKIPENQIIEISKSEESDQYLADKYAVTVRSIEYIKSGRTWGHITGIAYEKTIKLSDELVIEIANSKDKTKDLIAKYNLRKETILDIKKGARYGKVTKIQYHRKKLRKFSDEEIKHIISCTESNVRLGEKYGVSRSTISRIRLSHQ